MISPKPPAHESFSQSWLIENWINRDEFSCRKMFGGLAVYWNGRHVCFFAESADDLVWNGILFPTFRDHHAALIEKFPSLTPHSILGKWLYLKLNDPEYEKTAQSMIRLIQMGDLRIGIEPGIKRRKTKKTKKNKTAKKGTPKRPNAAAKKKPKK
jgi:hypothetical protein